MQCVFFVPESKLFFSFFTPSAFFCAYAKYGLDYQSKMQDFTRIVRSNGGIGRRARLRIWFPVK